MSFDLGLISDGPNECTLPVLSCVAQQPGEIDSSQILISAVTLESKDCTWNHAIDSLHCLQLLFRYNIKHWSQLDQFLWLKLNHKPDRRWMKGWNLDPIGLLLKRKMHLQIQSNFHWMSWKTALIKVKIEFFFPL